MPGSAAGGAAPKCGKSPLRQSSKKQRAVASTSAFEVCALENGWPNRETCNSWSLGFLYPLPRALGSWQIGTLLRIVQIDGKQAMSKLN